jgi:hypothetical protein
MRVYEIARFWTPLTALAPWVEFQALVRHSQPDSSHRERALTPARTTGAVPSVAFLASPCN